MTFPRSACLSLFALLLLPATPVLAGEVSAVINGKSFHVGATEDWNEDNFGLGVEYQFASESRWKTLLFANGFSDSSENMSYMLGAGLHRNLFASDRLRGFYIDAGINAFFMTREDINNNRPFPGALPSLTIGNRYVGINLSYMPGKAIEKLYDSRMMDETIRGIVFLQLKFNASALFGGD